MGESILGIETTQESGCPKLMQKAGFESRRKKVLLIFTQRVFPEPEKESISRLKSAIFTNSRDVDARTVVLATLANATQLLPVVFDKKRLKTRKDRLRQLAEGQVISKATKQAVEAVQAAVMVAAVEPSGRGVRKDCALLGPVATF